MRNNTSVLEDEKGKKIESNVVQKECNETRNTMNLSFARIISIDYNQMLLHHNTKLMGNILYLPLTLLCYEITTETIY